MKLIGNEILFVVFLIGLGVVSRVIPHPWNFTAIGTMALFSGFSVRSNKYLTLVPFAALLISDAALGFYDGMIYVYAAFAIGMILSLGYFRKQHTLSLGGRAVTIAGLSVVSSFLFFLITNFGVWIGSTMYTQNFSGLMMSYTMGLPFLYNQVAGDLFYGAVIFGVYEYMMASSRKEAKVTI
jgi:hypothetical protein